MRRRLRRVGGTVVTVVVAMLVLAGCGGVVGSLISTETSISSAGYSSVTVKLTDNNSALGVSASTSGSPNETEMKEIAGIVWHQFHYRFDTLTVTISGSGARDSRTFSFPEMEAAFGARDPAYNTTTLRSGLERFGLEIIIGFVLVAIIVVVLIIWLVRRRRRRRPAPWTGYPPSYGPGPSGPPPGGYGPGPPGPPPAAPPDPWAPAPPPSGWSDPSWEDGADQRS